MRRIQYLKLHVMHLAYSKMIKSGMTLLTKASFWASPWQLPRLFAAVLVHCEVSESKILCGIHWEVTSEDILFQKQLLFNMPQLKSENADIKNYSLLEIKECLKKLISSIEFHGMDIPHSSMMVAPKNKFIIENYILTWKLWWKKQNTT